MSELTIAVERRQEMGKNPNRRLRASGKVPAVVYGGDSEPIAIQVDNRTLFNLLRTGGENSIFLLELEGTTQKRHAMIRELQLDPRDGRMLHIDFQRILMTERVRVKVPVHLVGLAEGVKNESGMLDFVTREIEVECLPGDIPQRLEIEVTALHVGQHLEAGELALPPGVSLIDEPKRVLVSITAQRLAEKAEAEEEAELLEGAPAEPEVIGRSSKVEEEKD